MVLEIGEYKFPDSIDREKVEKFGRDVLIPHQKAGFTMMRFGWIQNDEGKNIAFFVGEMNSLEDIEKYRASKWHEELEKEISRLFPGIEAKERIVDVIE